MSWTLATVALAVLVVAAVSRRLTGGPITPAMVFVALGLLAGQHQTRRVADGLVALGVREGALETVTCNVSGAQGAASGTVTFTSAATKAPSIRHR